MSSSPTFAVVIPTYNRAQRLLGTLETVFSQKKAPTEIIVVDDCSTDDTPEVMAALAADHPEIHFIRHEVNLERAASRNTGLDHAKSDYVTFLDSDDRMYPNNLSDAAEFVDSTDSKFFHNLYESVDEAGNHDRTWPAPSLKNQIREIAIGNFLSCIGVFIHRDIYSAYRFDTNPVLTCSEDWELWLRVVADYPVSRISTTNSAFVQHPGRSMLNQDLAVATSRMEYILSKVDADPHLSEVYAPYRGLMRASRMVFLAGVANDNRDSKSALRFLKRALAEKSTIAISPRFIRCLQLALMNPFRRASQEATP